MNAKQANTLAFLVFAEVVSAPVMLILLLIVSFVGPLTEYGPALKQHETMTGFIIVAIGYGTGALVIWKTFLPRVKRMRDEQSARGPE